MKSRANDNAGCIVIHGIVHTYIDSDLHVVFIKVKCASVEVHTEKGAYFAWIKELKITDDMFSPKLDP